MKLTTTRLITPVKAVRYTVTARGCRDTLAISTTELVVLAKRVIWNEKHCLTLTKLLIL